MADDATAAAAKAAHIYYNELRVLGDIVDAGERLSERIYWLEEELRLARKELADNEFSLTQQAVVIKAAADALETIRKDSQT
jgi:hypothetical protein